MVGVEAPALIVWSRMVRFRDLSESPVFHAFLAQSPSLDEAKINDGDEP
jgi:hypothetical protein